MSFLMEVILYLSSKTKKNNLEFMKKKPSISVGIVISLILLFINFYYSFIKHPSDWRYIDFSSLHIHIIYFYKSMIVIPFLIAFLFFVFYSFFYKWAKKGLWITIMLFVIIIIWGWLYIRANIETINS